VLGIFGWAGWLGIFGLLLSPIVLMWGRLSRVPLQDVSPYVMGMGLLLAINVFDLLPNATLTPMTWMIAGALVGYAERDDILATRRSKKLTSVM
jgi:hypothetical protein